LKEFIIKYWMEVLFGLMIAGASAAYKRLSAKVHKQIADQRCLHSGTQALLRNEIIRAYDRYIEQGWIPIYGRENVLEMYDAYHKLGGNGTITKIMDELKGLPSKQLQGETP